MLPEVSEDVDSNHNGARYDLSTDHAKAAQKTARLFFQACSGNRIARYEQAHGRPLKNYQLGNPSFARTTRDQPQSRDPWFQSIRRAPPPVDQRPGNDHCEEKIVVRKFSGTESIAINVTVDNRMRIQDGPMIRQLRGCSRFRVMRYRGMRISCAHFCPVVAVRNPTESESRTFVAALNERAFRTRGA